jgi:hypothetical protein
LPAWSLRSLGIHAAVPTRKLLPARTRALLDHLRATFAGEAPSWSQALGPAPAHAAIQTIAHG